MNAKQLRNSILQMAIQGKLVPQDPNDEPASVLVQHIHKVKEHLVRGCKLKKRDLISEPITDEDKPFELPDGWVFVRMQDISLESADGPFGSNLKKEHYTDKKEVRIIQLSNIGELGWKDTNVKYTTFEHLSTIARSEAFAGDVIIAKMMPAGRAIICPQGDKKYVLSSDAVRFNFPDILNKRYLYYAINSSIVKDQVYGEVQGITRVRTSLNKLRTYIIPLPPLSEQHRIVAKLEKILPVVDEYGKAQEEADKLQAELPDKLRKSILQEAIQGKLVPQDPNDEPASILLDKIRQEKKRLVKVGVLKKSELKEIPISEDEFFADIPDSWVWTKMGNVGSWGAGATPSRGNPEYYGGDIPWLKTGELNNGIVSNSEEKVTKKALDDCSMRLNKPGDVMIAMYGATIGKLGIAGKTLTTNQACCACTPHLIYNWYLFYYLMANKDAFTKLGAGGAQPNISRDKLINYPFILPPLAEQHRIVSKIEQLFRELDYYNWNK